MTNQEIFDKVYRHLMTQNRQALGDASQCMYRAPDGAKCAVGCLIPDELYTLEVEGVTAYAALHSPLREKEKTLAAILRRIGVGQRNAELLCELQGVHDGRPPEGWAFSLKDIAARFRLTVPS